MSKSPQCPLISANGAPVAEDNNSITAGECGRQTNSEFVSKLNSGLSAGAQQDGLF